MRSMIVAATAALVAVLAGSASAQVHPDDVQAHNEIGLQIGATLTPSVDLKSGQSVEYGRSLALGADYDYRITRGRAAVYAGVDFLASPLDVKASTPPPNLSEEYAYLFLTPHVRVKWNPSGTLQPWGEVGGGYANFAPAQPRVPLTKVGGDGSTGAFVFGGGLDTKPLVHLPLPGLGKIGLGTRTEVRDFVSGQPNYGVPVSTDRLHTVALTTGLLLRF